MNEECRHGNAGAACWSQQCRAAASAEFNRERTRAAFRAHRQFVMASMTGKPRTRYHSDFGMRPAIADVPGASVGTCVHCADPIPPSELAAGIRAHLVCAAGSRVNAAIRLQDPPAPRQRREVHVQRRGAA